MAEDTISGARAQHLHTVPSFFSSVGASLFVLSDSLLAWNRFRKPFPAAQALIQIGPKSIKPILQALIEYPESDDVRVGAHHVFHDLHTRDYDDVLRPLMASLEDSTLTLGIDLEATKALKKL